MSYHPVSREGMIEVDRISLVMKFNSENRSRCVFYEIMGIKI